MFSNVLIVCYANICRSPAAEVVFKSVREADLILVAERNQISQVEALDRTARGKVFALGNWEEIDVVDPHGKSESSYRASLTLIERLAAGWIERIC